MEGERKMEKGKFGIRFCFYAVLAFILAVLGYSTVLFLLAGVVLVVEKNEWATKQVIQAICLCIASGIINAILGVFDFIYKIPFVGTAWGVICGLISGILGLLILIFAIIAIVNTAKGKDAGVPLAKKFADWAYGIVTIKVTTTTTTTVQTPAQPAATEEKKTEN